MNTSKIARAFSWLQVLFVRVVDDDDGDGGVVCAESDCCDDDYDDRCLSTRLLSWSYVILQGEAS